MAVDVEPDLAAPDAAARAAAFVAAAAFRDLRASLRRDLSAGVLTLAEVVSAADTSDVGGVKLLFVLESLPGAGKVATRRRLAALGLEESVPLAALGPAERATVLAEFPLAATGITS